MFLLVPAHPGFPGQIPQSRKTVVCVCVCDSPECDTCQCALMVKHVLIECVKFNHVRIKFFSAASMKGLLEHVDALSNIDFIKESNFYHHV